MFDQEFRDFKFIKRGIKKPRECTLARIVHCTLSLHSIFSYSNEVIYLIIVWTKVERVPLLIGHALLFFFFKWTVSWSYAYSLFKLILCLEMDQSLIWSKLLESNFKFLDFSPAGVFIWVGYGGRTQPWGSLYN